jgi:hypothetical protein
MPSTISSRAIARCYHQFEETSGAADTERNRPSWRRLSKQAIDLRSIVNLLLIERQNGIVLSESGLLSRASRHNLADKRPASRIELELLSSCLGDFSQKRSEIGA